MDSLSVLTGSNSRKELGGSEDKAPRKLSHLHRALTLWERDDSDQGARDTYLY